MDDRLKLGGEERIYIEAFIDTYEKKAKQWKSRRYVILGGAIIALYGFCVSAYDFTSHSFFEKGRILEDLKKETVPTNVPLEYWVAGYVNKVAAVYERHQNFDNLCLFQGIFGLLMFVCFLINITILVSRWNNDKRDMIVVKIMRHYSKEWSGSSEEKQG